MFNFTFFEESDETRITSFIFKFFMFLCRVQEIGHFWRIFQLIRTALGTFFKIKSHLNLKYGISFESPKTKHHFGAQTKISDSKETSDVARNSKNIIIFTKFHH